VKSSQDWLRSVQAKIVALTAPRWAVGSLGLLYDEQVHVLLLKHRFRSKPWGFPGGLAAWPESPVEALVREIREELGCVCHADFLELRGHCSGQKLALLENLYVARGPLTQIQIQSFRLQKREISEARWLPPEAFENRTSLEKVLPEGMLERHREWALRSLRTLGALGYAQS
jgi:8-oxo-dGTP pyrophosphatase MutT (NUDIX family)